MTVAADYAKVIDAMHRARPAYVAYAIDQSVSGIANTRDTGRVVVRTADGAIVHGRTPHDEHLDTKDAFDPACYSPDAESTVQRNGRALVEFVLHATCRPADEAPFTSLDTMPQTFRPLEARGTRDHENTRVDVVERFTTVDDVTVPSSLKVDISGRSLGSWLQVHVLQRFSDYRFFASDPGASAA